MADSGADGAQADGEDGANSVPASKPTAEQSVPINEKIKKDFNFSEFLQLASRVIDEGDADSMAALLNLKRRWSEKFGEIDSNGAAGHGGFRPSRPLTIAAPLSTRPPSLENEAPRSMHLEPPQAELFITQGAASRLEPPTKDLGAENPNLLGAATHLEPPTSCLGKDELFIQGTTACLEPPTDLGSESSRAARVSLNPRAASTLGMAAHSSNDACPLSNVERPAAAVLNFSASMNLATSPSPLAAPWVPTMDPRPPSAIVVGEGAVGLVGHIATAAIDRVCPATSPPEILIGNIPLKPCSDLYVSEDKIATAFHNSSHKTLTFIPTSEQNGEVLVRPTIDMIRQQNFLNSKQCGYGRSSEGLGFTIWTADCAKMELACNFDLCEEKQIPAPAPRTGDPIPNSDPVFDQPVDKDDMMSNELPHKKTDKGKQIVTYNAFDILRDADEDAYELIRGPNTCSPSDVFSMLNTVIWNVRGLKGDIIRVMPSNISRVHAGLLPRWRWFTYYSGPGNRIWIAWNDDIIDVDILNIGSQFVHCRVLKHDMHEPIFLTVVYGANEVSARREVWQGLTELAMSVNLPWLVGGDFNAVLDMSEYGWKEPWKRLDRMFVNDAWLERWPNLFYTCLTPRTSDHSPLVLKGDSRDVQHLVFGTPMYSVTRKLKALKLVFRQQRQKKGDLAMNVKLAAGFLEIAQKLLQADRHNSLLLQLENCCRFSSDEWLPGGLISVFSRSQTVMALFKQIPPINSVFVTYFQDLLGGDRTERVLDLHYLRPWARHILTEEEAYALIRPVTVDDVKKAMFDIEEDKAPGPDGKLLKQVTASVLTLIPKVRTPHSVADFRPISCCNVIYKVISKILVCRFREILDLLISPSQNALVPGRLISDNVLLAQELFSGYNQCRLPPRCALKVDLRKAYDTVEWDFLFATLRLFGFPAVFIRWIEECVTSAHYSVVVNGGVHGFFGGTRTQAGDPMSPYLFVLVMEVLQMILQQFIDQDGHNFFIIGGARN
ncbi:hypothetical protein Sango_3033900 [Sesamum angolense]|uniref:Reverse transcriptase domain-containing protein n=1 Tax=Sesamum angolense TaxID=2727404 RepID=A0AAE1W1B2_9LAMI|nr:hypothetical protein Sango_3033900 [Sesamum angolense]